MRKRARALRVQIRRAETEASLLERALDGSVSTADSAGGAEVSDVLLTPIIASANG